MKKVAFLMLTLTLLSSMAFACGTHEEGSEEAMSEQQQTEKTA